MSHEPPRSDALVFFGATGDLAYKKIFPALQAMARRGRVDFPIVGVAKSGWTREQFLDRCKASLNECGGGVDEGAFARFGPQLRYVDGDYNDPATFNRLRAELANCKRPAHYLAIPPSMFPTVVQQLGKAGCTTDARVIVESGAQIHRHHRRMVAHAGATRDRLVLLARAPGAVVRTCGVTAKFSLLLPLAVLSLARTGEARDAYLQAIALNPRRIDPYNALAAIAAERGRWDEAAERYTELLEIAPDFVDVRRSLGEAYLASGRKEDARREWRIAIQLAPGAGLALADLCMSYYDEGVLVDAAPYCERAVQARPDLPETHFAMGLVARALRRRDRARAELAEAVHLFPQGAPGRRRAEEILDRMRRHDERLPEGAPPQTLPPGEGDLRQDERPR